jgi:hypothetical protein
MAGGDGFDAVQLQGLHNQLEHFWLLAGSVLQQFKDPVVPRLGLNASALFANSAFSKLYWLESVLLGAGLEQSVRLYRAEGIDLLSRLEVASTSFFIVNTLAMLALCVVLYWLAVAQVQQQLQYREDVLMLLPTRMLHQTKRLRQYLRQHQKRRR